MLWAISYLGAMRALFYNVQQFDNRSVREAAPAAGAQTRKSLRGTLPLVGRAHVDIARPTVLGQRHCRRIPDARMRKINAAPGFLGKKAGRVV